MGAACYYKQLYEIAQKVNSSLAPTEVLDAIVQSVVKAIGAKGCSLLLFTPDREYLTHAADYGLSEWYLRKGPIRAGVILSELSQGKPIVMLNAPEDPRCEYPEAARQEGVTSMLSIPLMLSGDVIGALRIYTSEPREFTTEDIDFLSAVANLGAIALEKAKLHESKLSELEESAKELKRLEEGREQLLRFLGIAAHDLKAPLAAIQSYLNVMLGGFVGELNEKQGNMLQRSSIRITELLNLISDLLDIPRIETGQLVQEIRTTSITEILDDCVEELRSLSEQKGIELEANIPKSISPIKASGPRVKQVVCNLVSNAINYSTEGSKMTLNVKESDGEILVEVLDEGIGIPPQDLPHVFDDFFRASNVETKGTGLGLSIAKRIIEAHGGRIWVESPPP